MSINAVLKLSVAISTTAASTNGSYAVSATASEVSFVTGAENVISRVTAGSKVGSAASAAIAAGYTDMKLVSQIVSAISSVSSYVI